MRNATKTRAQILSRNYETIRLHGFQGLRADKVITSIGITKGALYHYFANKQELGYAIVDELIAPQYLEAWSAFEQATENHIGVLVDCVKQYKNRIDAKTVHLGSPFNTLAQEMAPLDEGFKTRLQAIAQQMHQSLETGFRNGQAAGTIAPGLEPAKAAWFVLSSLEGGFSMAKLAGSLDASESTLSHLTAYLQSLAV